MKQDNRIDVFGIYLTAITKTEFHWLATDIGIEHGCIGVVLVDNNIDFPVGFIDPNWLEKQQRSPLPPEIWFTQEFLNHAAEVGSGGECPSYDKGVEFGNLLWHLDFLPDGTIGNRQFVGANYQGRQYKWEIVQSCGNGCHSLGVWRD